MDLRDAKVLVTGADGFIGSHLVELLVREGCAVRALVQYNSFNSWGWLDRVDRDVRDAVEVVAGDVRDAALVESVMSGCAVVLHLAALIAIPYSYAAPASYVDTNVTGTLNVVQAARKLGVAKVVHTSTSEVYGTGQIIPMTEDHPLHAQSPYAATKIGADQMALSFYHSFSTPVAVARPFNTYGPRQSARAVIPTIITQILGGAETIKLGSLHPTRDFVFVRDTARGLAAVARADATVGEVVNLGTGFEMSIGELAVLIAEVIGADVRVEEDSVRLRPRGSEVERLCASAAKALRLTGWTPERAGREGLAAGLAETVEWYRRPENLAAFKWDRYSI